MQSQLTFYLLLGYFVILAAIVYWSSRGQSSQDFAIGSRQVGFVDTTASLVAGFRDGAGIVVWLLLSIVFQFGALWLTVGMLLGLALLAISAKRVNELSRQQSYVTVNDLIADKFGTHTAFVASIIIVVAVLLISAAQLSISGNIFGHLFQVSPLAGVWITTGIIGVYLLLSMIRSELQRNVKRSWLNEKTLQIARIVGLGLLFLGLLVYVVASTVTNNTFFALSVPTGVWLVAISVSAYLVMGGYKTIVKTDVFQWLLVLLIVILLPILLWRSDVVLAPSTFISIPPVTALGFAGISFLVVYSSPDVWQRIFSAKSGGTAQGAILAAGPIYLVITIGLVIFGVLLGARLENVAPDKILHAIYEMEAAPTLAVSLLSVFILVAVMSTLDTQVFLFAQTITRNLVPKRFIKNEQASVRISRAIIIAVLALLGLVAVYVRDLITFLFGAVTIMTILSPVLFLSIHRQQAITATQDRQIAATIIVVALIYGVMFIAGAFENLLFTLVPALLASAMCSVVLAFSRDSDALD
ncbi:MAG: hypothetical protein HKM24_00140 [Gammaproteobacteria bacterium]|nr:hypothetical protein [Gammaproteobacteria bacterium]